MSFNVLNDEDSKEKPKVYIENIIFNDNTVLELDSNSIVVFTGANNSGKSQVLKDIELFVENRNSSIAKVVRDCNIVLKGSIIENDFIKEHFYINQEGLYQVKESTNAFLRNQLIRFWKNSSEFYFIYKLFIHRLSTDERLTASRALNRAKPQYYNSIIKLYKNEEIAQSISEYFRQAFECDLVVNRNELTDIPLHVGKAPNKTLYTIDKQDDYYNAVEKLPKLDEQGDGMKSFATILLDAFTSNYPITLIDEPEAFLHPPQARILGKMFSKNIMSDRQLFISTHSEDFLIGLIDSGAENINVIRIDRDNEINHMSVLQSDKIKTLWGNPILRYSNILSGLFHKMVIVCESDYDCLFYQSMITAMYEKKKEIAPDILFTHCGGKARIKDIVAALKAVNVKVAAITDFDLLNRSQIFKPLVEAFGIDWNNTINKKMQIIYDSMNGKNSKTGDAWTNIKKIGKAGFTDKAPEAYEYVEKDCKAGGLFIVPVGEMECFDKTINKEKKEWVYHVLENYDLANEQKLEEARKFLTGILEYGFGKCQY